MNAKLSFAALLLFILCGCAASQAPEMPVVPCDDATAGSDFAPTGERNTFVSYTETEADFRAYGERSPRDQFITQARAGNNISAVIPPRADDEYMDYEEEIVSSESGELNGDGSNSGEFSPEDPVEDWLAEEGKTLKGLLTEWSEKSGWRLVWKSNRNYTLTAGAMFRGRFADVSSALIRAFARAKPAPIGTFYKGNRVLVVETLEDENAY